MAWNGYGLIMFSIVTLHNLAGFVVLWMIFTFMRIFFCVQNNEQMFCFEINFQIIYVNKVKQFLHKSTHNLFITNSTKQKKVNKLRVECLGVK